MPSDDGRLLYRHITLSYCENPRTDDVNPAAFSTAGHGKVSFYDGRSISVEDSVVDYERRSGNTVSGVLGVTVGQCEELGLKVVFGEDFPEHATVYFSDMNKRARSDACQDLYEMAVDRGWLYMS